MSKIQSLSAPGYYEIWVRGCLDSDWSDWFDGLAVITTESGETLLAGSFVDQSALYGLIEYLFNKGLVLISLKRVC